jgi:hypothetical protein
MDGDRMDDGLMPRRVYESGAVRDLTLLACVLKTAQGIAERFGDDNPDGCGCDFCPRFKYADGVRQDVAGIAWVIGSTAGLVESILPRIYEDLDRMTGGETFADDLRRLADYAAAATPDEAEADEPAVVG